MRRTHLAGYFGVGEALSEKVISNVLETKSIMLKRTEVVAKNLFVEIPEQVEGFDRNVCALQSALEQTPEILQTVSVNLSVNVALRMVDNFVPEIFLESHVGHERIGVDRAACFDMSGDVGLQSVLFAIGNDHSADFAAAFQHAEYSSLVFGASFSNPATVFLAVHVSGSAADEGFVYLDFAIVATEFEDGAILHCKPNAVKHEPCGFLSDAEGAANFVGTDSILAVSQHPKCDEPFVEGDWGVLKDSSDLRAELFPGVLCFAFPHSPSRDKANVFTSASWALDTIGPAALDHEVEAVVGVGEVDDGLLQGFWLSHGSLDGGNVPCGIH
jgi:hypothetical protein